MSECSGQEQTSVYLASASPRRAELLAQIGVRYSRVDVSVDESRLGDEPAADYVRRLALEKACAGWRALEPDCKPWPVLGADTAVVIDGEILGKPQNREQGIAMLQQLSGRSHQVYSAVALLRGARHLSALSCTQVNFRLLTNDEIAKYWDSGEGWDKAGCYAIQGRAAVFVESINGSYSGVVGLPLMQTWQLLMQMDVAEI